MTIPSSINVYSESTRVARKPGELPSVLFRTAGPLNVLPMKDRGISRAEILRDHQPVTLRCVLLLYVTVQVVPAVFCRVRR
jgi:hypothetical protein